MTERVTLAQEYLLSSHYNRDWPISHEQWAHLQAENFAKGLVGKSALFSFDEDVEVPEPLEDNPLLALLAECSNGTPVKVLRVLEHHEADEMFDFELQSEDVFCEIEAEPTPVWPALAVSLRMIVPSILLNEINAMRRPAEFYVGKRLRFEPNLLNNFLFETILGDQRDIDRAGMVQVIKCGGQLVPEDPRNFFEARDWTDRPILVSEDELVPDDAYFVGRKFVYDRMRFSWWDSDDHFINVQKPVTVTRRLEGEDERLSRAVCFMAKGETGDEFEVMWRELKEAQKVA